MKKHLYIVLLFAFNLLVVSGTAAQEIFRLDFEDTFLPDDWVDTDKSEWAHLLGEDQSSYFRFHPFSWRDFLQSPMLELSEGTYTLYYSWNETGSGNPNFINIRLREDAGFWTVLKQFGSGNQRTWVKDSLVIGELPTGTYQLEFEYKSLGKFPSQYMNLDNIHLVRRDIVTGIEDNLPDVALSVFPNPANEVLHFRIVDQKQRSFSCQVINTLGQTVIDARETDSGGQLDVSGLSAGSYELEIRFGDRVTTRRFVIVR